MPSGKNLYLDTQGRFRTRSLFIEMINKEQIAGGYTPIYTLKGDPDYIDIHELYIESDDPTEYAFGVQAFSTWEHFQHIADLDWFKAYLTVWRDELAVRMKAMALKSLMIQAVRPDGRGITAAKYIADKGWEQKRGRPSKEEIAKEKKQQAQIKNDLEDDAKRLGLHAVK